MYKVDLNSDVGERFGHYTFGSDSKVLQYVTSANIACGWHAGDPMTMTETVREAILNNVAIGAHPGYNDLLGFGRRNIAVSDGELKAYVKYQIGALDAFLRGTGKRIQHVKPHGAMYNMAATNKNMARAIAEAVFEFDPSVILLGLANSELIAEAEHAGLRTANEVFADRAYCMDGTLVPRTESGAVIHDLNDAIHRTVRMIKEGVVESIEGKLIPIKAHSICVHGDHPEAVAFLRAMRKRFSEENIEVVSLSHLF